MVDLQVGIRLIKKKKLVADKYAACRCFGSRLLGKVGRRLPWLCCVV